MTAVTDRLVERGWVGLEEGRREGRVAWTLAMRECFRARGKHLPSVRSVIAPHFSDWIKIMVSEPGP